MFIEIRIGSKAFGMETVKELRDALDLAEELGGRRVTVKASAKKRPRLTAAVAEKLTEAQRLARNEASKRAKARAAKKSRRKGK